MKSKGFGFAGFDAQKQTDGRKMHYIGICFLLEEIGYPLKNYDRSKTDNEISHF